jgi:hypothetical protein
MITSREDSIESRNHLFFVCLFVVLCWKYLCPDWNALTSNSFEVHAVISNLKDKTAKHFSLEHKII